MARLTFSAWSRKVVLSKMRPFDSGRLPKLLLPFSDRISILNLHTGNPVKRLIHSEILAILAISISCNWGFGADQITLQFKQSGGHGEVGLHSQMVLPLSAMYPEYTILRSSNLMNSNQRQRRSLG